MIKRKKTKNFFSANMQPKIQEIERAIISDKPLTKTKNKLFRFRKANFNKI